MRLSHVLFQVSKFLLPPCIISLLWLNFYPLLHDCNFPPAKRAEAACYLDSDKALKAVPETAAPFRLLALGDPQLEGDTKLPNPNDPKFPSLLALRKHLASTSLSSIPSGVATTLVEFGSKDVPRLIQSYRKRLDLFGNDYYLSHIYHSVHKWAEPTHTVVLGDLLGSQWISDEEFNRRSNRFWHRVFKGSDKVPEVVIGAHQDESLASGTISEPLDEHAWSKRLINVVGNHDIGYAGDIDERRIERFERAFGKVNWRTHFRLPADDVKHSSSSATFPGRRSPQLRLVVLNSMNLDSPAWTKSAQDETTAFLKREIASTRRQGPNDATILLTHIPLHKDAGVCVDGPFFDYFPADQGGGIREQNHLSYDSSRQILDGLFPSAQQGQGIILNGHDHEGCDSYHYHNQSDIGTERGAYWNTFHTQRARALSNDAGKHGIREITVRSMMGEFGGNAGLLSAWFDSDTQRWRFEYQACIFGSQHLWWATHVLAVLVIMLGLTTLISAGVEVWLDRHDARQVLQGPKEKAA